MKEERSIKIAFDKKSGKRLFADEIFDDRLIGFDYRAKYNRNEIEPYCVECFEKLTIPSSKYQTKSASICVESAQSASKK